MPFMIIIAHDPRNAYFLKVFTAVGHSSYPLNLEFEPSLRLVNEPS